jgi:hypothetical protein
VDEGPDRAAAGYRRALSRLYGRSAATTTPITAAMLSNPRLAGAAGRLLTAPGVGRMLAGGWSVYWNDLLDGASPGWPQRTAGVADRVAGILTWTSRDRRWVTTSLAADLEGPAARLTAGR